MRSWLGMIIGAAVVVAVVYVFANYASSRLGNRQNPPESQGTLIGKPAPDFHGDFALNGKPVTLADLKGKVVLLDFWAVWCPPCIKSFSHLREWNAAYKKAGLEVVGLTAYNFETGRYLGFDAVTGKLTKLTSSNKSSEQQMLREFASYHKLDYLLMPLPSPEAQKAYTAYDVDGIPQMVLIDRKGIIRKIGVGAAEDTADDILSGIKTLLAE